MLQKNRIERDPGPGGLVYTACAFLSFAQRRLFPLRSAEDDRGWGAGG
jgi:hypothetical protein